MSHSHPRAVQWLRSIKPNQRNTKKVTKMHTVGLLQRLGAESTGAHGVCLKSNRNIKKFIPKVRPVASSWGRGVGKGTPGPECGEQRMWFCLN